MRIFFSGHNSTKETYKTNQNPIIRQCATVLMNSLTHSQVGRRILFLGKEKTKNQYLYISLFILSRGKYYITVIGLSHQKNEIFAKSMLGQREPQELHWFSRRCVRQQQCCTWVFSFSDPIKGEEFPNLIVLITVMNIK